MQLKDQYFMFMIQINFQVIIVILILQENEMIGRGETLLSEVLKAGNQKLEIPIFDKVQKNKTGILIIKAIKVKEDDQFISWKWKGINLMNTDGFFGKSDPFLKFLKETEGKIWLQMHKTEVIQDNLNPIWKKFEISTQRLCNGNFDQPFKVQCFDLHEKGTNNQFMGQFTTTLNEILNKKKQEFKLELKNNKIGGVIQVDEIETNQRQSFSNYQKSGYQINYIVGIDYTMKNGNIEFPDSLHQLHSDGKQNLYQKLLHSISKKIMLHTPDKKIPIYGFGAIPKLEKLISDEVENCFPLTGDYQHPEIKGLEEIQQVYLKTLKKMIFAGPGELEDIVNYAKEIAEANIKKDIYIVLIILTCGCIQDLETVSSLLAQSVKSPLSLVLVGIGQFDFSNLMKLEKAQIAKQLEANPQQKPRSIVKFINSSSYLQNLELLESILLNDIPQQFLEYKELSLN